MELVSGKILLSLRSAVAGVLADARVLNGGSDRPKPQHPLAVRPSGVPATQQAIAE
jgi:hypothetical protein